MANKVQIIKGFLEGFVLEVLSKEPLFTHEIIQRLDDMGYKNLSEGTIYPLMLRLEAQFFIEYTKVANPLGPMKKRYRITQDGIEELDNIKTIWVEFKTISDHILGGK
jgi:PadR family transcriptional regulator, regulatory protein PadR